MERYRLKGELTGWTLRARLDKVEPDHNSGNKSISIMGCFEIRVIFKSSNQASAFFHNT
jgi:hypothetical protein